MNSNTSTTTTVTNENAKIKALVLTSHSSGSDYSNLQVKEEEYPKLEKEDQCIIRMKACGLNFAELMQRQGTYRPATKTPYTPGYEGSGLVENIGTGVTDLKVNDRVVVFSSSGIWKEVVCLPRSNVVKIPDNMSFEDAAAILVNYVTAYQILFRLANIKPGDSILIHMAAGGVGTAATQLCRTIPGVKIFGTASSAKHDAIRENGVDYPIDYTTSDYVQEVKKISPYGVDVVLDPLNGSDSLKGYDLLKPLGRIVHFGAASMTSEHRSLVNAFKTWWKCLSINSLDIMSENKSVNGYHLGVLLNNPITVKTVMDDLNTIFELYEQNKIKIKIDSTYSFSKIGEAMKRMHTRQNIGKIILKPDSEIGPVQSEEDKVITTTITTVVKTTTSPTTSNKTTTPPNTTETAPAVVEPEQVKIDDKLKVPETGDQNDSGNQSPEEDQLKTEELIQANKENPTTIASA